MKSGSSIRSKKKKSNHKLPKVKKISFRIKQGIDDKISSQASRKMVQNKQSFGKLELQSDCSHTKTSKYSASAVPEALQEKNSFSCITESLDVSNSQATDILD